MNSRRRIAWYRTAHTLHWVSAAVCLAALLLFSVTGVTLNHASAIGAAPVVRNVEAELPGELRASLAAHADGVAAWPAGLREWLQKEFDFAAVDGAAEWSPDELYVSSPGPGRDAWVSIDRHSGAVKYESTERGWVAYLNDLHKGRNTGLVWKVFIDVVAVACLFFSLTGLWLLQIQARQRRSTWPLVGGGIGIVVVLMIFFAH